MTTPDRFEVLEGGPAVEDREERLIEGAEVIVSERRRGNLLHHERFLISVAASLMALGVAIILVGWAGAADATVVEEQVPYLISGGLLGVALTTIGALTLFSHWLTVGIREARAREVARRQDHAELIEALELLAGSLANREGAGNGAARSTRTERPVRRAPRGR